MIIFKRILVIKAAILILISIMGGTEGLRAAPQDSVCYHFTGNTHITLKSGHTLSGSTPVTFCTLMRGEKYRLTADGTGLERRLGTFTIGPTGTPRVSGIRLGTSTRNALLPGFGYYDTGVWEAAVSDEFSLAASLYFLYIEHREFKHLENRYTIYMDDLNSAEILETKKILEVAAQEAAIDVNIQNKHRKRLVAVSAYIYGWQVLDPFILSGPPRTSMEGSVIHLESPGISKPKAFILSLVRPGRGQLYQGKKGRGALFNILTAAAGLTALEYLNRYDVEESRYELLIDRYDRAGTLDEKNSLARQASAQWDDVEKAKKNRNAAYIITAGIWGWNLLDTLFESGGRESQSLYSLELSPVSSALVIRF